MKTQPHILIVDDDREIRTLLADYLEKNGYRVSVASDGKSMRRTMDHGGIDLIVLDIMMPGEDGLTICRTLRSTSSVPIIVLSALGEEVDRIVGLEVGADDYLVKPFNPRELLGRIRSVLRRVSPSARRQEALTVNAYRFGDWRLDTISRTLTHTDGRSVALGGADFKLLSVLLARATRVLSRNELMELVRGRPGDPFDRSIDVGISRLRQTLGDEARSPQIIKTVYGEGYIIGVKVEGDPPP